MRKRAHLDPETRRKRLWRRLIVYGGLLIGLLGAYKFQPIEIDFLPRQVPILAALDPDTTRLFSKGTRVLVITAHPDDSEFYIGGTLLLLHQAGARVQQMIHTDGDKAYYFWTDTSELREVRRAEQREASAHYGVHDIRFLGLPDGRLRVDDDVIAKTAAMIREVKPDYVMGFDGEYPPRASHQDHSRSGDIVFAACKAARFSGWLLRFNTMVPTAAIDVGPVWSERVSLLGIHRSQFSGEKLRRIEAFIADGAAAIGEKNGFTFAEGFRAEPWVGGMIGGRK